MRQIVTGNEMVFPIWVCYDKASGFCQDETSGCAESSGCKLKVVEKTGSFARNFQTWRRQECPLDSGFRRVPPEKLE